MLRVLVADDAEIAYLAYPAYIAYMKRVAPIGLLHWLRATESAGRVQVTTCADADEFWLRIDDDDCGIAEIAAERTFARFVATLPLRREGDTSGCR